MSAKYKFQYNPAFTGDKRPYSIVFSDYTLPESRSYYSSRRQARRAAIVENLRLPKNLNRFLKAGDWIKMSEYIAVP